MMAAGKMTPDLIERLPPVRGRLYSIDPATLTTTLLGSVTVAGDAINFHIGLATDPTTGIIYGVVNLVSDGGCSLPCPGRKVRTLVTIDVASLTATVSGKIKLILESPHRLGLECTLYARHVFPRHCLRQDVVDACSDNSLRRHKELLLT